MPLHPIHMSNSYQVYNTVTQLGKKQSISSPYNSSHSKWLTYLAANVMKMKLNTKIKIFILTKVLQELNN